MEWFESEIEPHHHMLLCECVRLCICVSVSVSMSVSVSVCFCAFVLFLIFDFVIPRLLYIYIPATYPRAKLNPHVHKR